MWVVNFIVLFFLMIFVASCNYEPNEIIYTNATINVLDKDVSRVSVSSCEMKITVSGSVVFVDLMFPNLCSESDYLISLEYFDGVITLVTLLVVLHPHILLKLMIVILN